MAVLLIFKMNDGFKRDKIVKKVSKKLWNNYKFKHITRGDYLFTPDLTNLIVNPFSMNKRNKNLLLYLLTLYKYCVWNNLLTFFNVSSLPNNPLNRETLKTLINFVTNREKTYEIPVTLKHIYTFRAKTSVVMEVFDEVENTQLFNKQLTVINLNELVGSEFDENKPPLLYLLEAPLSKIPKAFNDVITGEYYTIKDENIVKAFELSKEQMFYQDTIENNLRTPPVKPLLEHYLKTGKLLKVEGCTPQEELVRNFNSLILDRNLGCIYSNRYGSGFTLSKYNKVKLNIDDGVEFDDEVLKKHYDLLKNLVSVNKWFAKKLYDSGFTNINDFFNPPISAIKDLLKEATLGVVSAPHSNRYDVKLIWRNIKSKREVIPYLIILEVVVYTKNLIGTWSALKKYYAVFNRLFYSDSLNTRYFNVREISNARDIIFKHIPTISLNNKLEVTIV